MKVVNKINSLMIALENEEVKEIQNTIEMEIIRITDLIPKEVELIKAYNELRKLSYALSQGIMVETDILNSTKDKVDALKLEIDEEIKN